MKRRCINCYLLRILGAPALAPCFLTATIALSLHILLSQMLFSGETPGFYVKMLRVHLLWNRLNSAGVGQTTGMNIGNGKRGQYRQDI